MRFTLAALTLAMAANLAAQQKVNIQRTASPTVSVRLMGAVSNVRVIGWDRDSISLTGSLGAGTRMDGGPGAGTGVVNGMKFFIEAPDEAAVKSNRIELRVPSGARVWIKAGSADIDASGMTGGLDLNIVGGSVHVTSKPRELIIESMDGAVSFAGDAEYAKIKTATGDVEWAGKGDDVSITTVSGAIRVGEGVVQRGRFESVTGGITFAADFPRGSDVRFDTHSGVIDLRLVRNANVEIDASSVTGTIENGWTKTRPVMGREGRGMELGISSGIAAARVSVRSFKGNVRLTAR